MTTGHLQIPWISFLPVHTQEQLSITSGISWSVQLCEEKWQVVESNVFKETLIEITF